MSQHDYDILNSDGATVRADINSMAEAIATLNSGATAPSTTFSYMWWADTATGILKRRNAANTAWVSVMTLATGNIIGTDVQAYNAALATIAGLSIVAGDVLYGSGANTVARLAKGTNGQFLKLVSGLPAWGNGSNAPDFTALGQTVTLDSDLSVAHGLGAAPTTTRVTLRCINSDQSYPVGFAIPIGEGGTHDSDDGCTHGADATNVNIIMGDSFPVINKTTFNSGNITPSKWVWDIQVWA